MSEHTGTGLRRDDGGERAVLSFAAVAGQGNELVVLYSTVLNGRVYPVDLDLESGMFTGELNGEDAETGEAWAMRFWIPGNDVHGRSVPA